MAAAAFACVSGPVVNLSTINAKVGQEVGITGTGFQAANNAVVRFNALDGPVLTTVNAPDRRRWHERQPGRQVHGSRRHQAR